VTLRVGILTYDFVPFIGGQGRVTHDLWRRMRDRNDMDMTVISPSHNELAGHVSRFAFTQRVGRHPLFSLLASTAARRWSSALELDILHVNGGPGGVLLLANPGVPVLYSVYHTYAQVARLTPGQHWKSPLARVERAAYGRSARIIASTASTAAALRHAVGARTPIEVIPCGVDFDAFSPTGVPRDEETVLFVGRLDVRKNAQLLIRAFASVVKQRPGARLVIVGRGSLERRLRDLAAQLGIASRITFECFVDQKRLVDWYNRATVVAVPSLFEGFGLSAAEAQACGACVVATDSEGLRDVIIDGETGVLTAREPRAFAAAILDLLALPARRAELGANAHAHVRTVYGWDDVADRFARVYRDVYAGMRRS
jgi:D-inositol-3-phosphate glycosyltransferase